MSSSRPTTQPLRPFIRFPSQSAAPVDAAATTNAAILYTDGTDLLTSINAGAYVALMTTAGGTFTGPITINTATTPALDIRTDGVSGNIFRIQHDVSTTPTGALTGILVDLDTNWVAGNVAHTGVSILMPASTNTASRAISVTHAGPSQVVVLQNTVTSANTQNLFSVIRSGTVSAADDGASIYSLDQRSLSGGISELRNHIECSGELTFTGGANSLASNYLSISHTPTLSGGTLTDSSVGALIVMSPAATSSAPVTGIIARVSANASGTAASGRFDYQSAAGTTNGVLRVEIGASTALTNGGGSPLTGIIVNLQTNLTPNNNQVSGVQILIPATTRANTAGEAAIVVDSLATAARAIDIAWSNTSGTLATMRYRGAVTTAGAITGLSLDLTTNVTPGALAVTGISIAVPATSRANTAGEGALVINSDATAARAIDVDIANTSGTVFIMRYGAATTIASDIIFWDLSLQTNVTPGANYHTGIFIRIPATTAAAAATQGALNISSFATAQRSINVTVRNTSGTIAGLSWDAATTSAGALTGWLIDLTTNVTPGAQAHTGLDIRIPATTRASTAAEGAIVVNSDAVSARVLDLDVANTGGTIAQIRWGAAATTLSSITGLLIDMTTNMTPGSSIHIGLDIRTPATTVADGTDTAALRINSDATASRVVDVDAANTSGTIAYIRYGAAATLSGATTGLDINLSGNVTPGANQVTGLALTIPASSSTSTRAITVTSTATAGGVFNASIANTSGTAMQISYTGAATLAGGFTGVLFDFDTNVTGNGQAITGQRIVVSAGAAAASAALRLDYRATAGSVGVVDLSVGAATTLTGALTGINLDLATNVTAGTNQVTGATIAISAAAGSNGSRALNLTRTGAPTAASEYTGSFVTISNTPTATNTITEAGFLFDISHAPVAGAGGITDTTTGLRATMSPLSGDNSRGIQIIMGANAASASYCATLDYRGTAGTAAGNGILNIEVGAATSPTGQLVGIECDISTNVTPGAVAYMGERILLPASTRANTAGEAALVISSDMTVARCFDFDVANQSGTIGIIRYGGAVTLTSTALVGLDINLSTNVTAATNDPQITGIIVRIPATDAAGVTGVGGVVIASLATAQRVLDINTANVSGDGIVAIRYPVATTITGSLNGLVVDLQTGVTPGANQIDGVRVFLSGGTGVALRMEVATAEEDTTPYIGLGGKFIFADEGAPADANGANGDYYFRKDAAAATAAIFVKLAGVWTAI